MNDRKKEINDALEANEKAQCALRRAAEALREERAVLVDDRDRAEMKRRGWYTHTWAVTEKWATAHVCPFCLTACAARRQGKEFPNEQNAEYHCGNAGAIK